MLRLPPASRRVDPQCNLIHSHPSPPNGEIYLPLPLACLGVPCNPDYNIKSLRCSTKTAPLTVLMLVASSTFAANTAVAVLFMDSWLKGMRQDKGDKHWPAISLASAARE